MHIHSHILAHSMRFPVDSQYIRRFISTYAVDDFQLKLFMTINKNIFEVPA